MYKLITLFTAVSFCLALFAQKPDKNKYKGHYKNIPVYQLSAKEYSFTHNTPDLVKDLMQKDTLALELKGLKNGKGMTIVFYSSEPQIIASVEEESKKVNDKTVTSYYALLSAKSESKVIVMNEDGLPIEIITATPDYKWVNDDGFKKGSYSEASKDLESRKKSNSDLVKKKYIRQLIEAYQDELDNRYGLFAHEATMRVFSIKAKKFNYDDFNAATQSFIEATSTKEVSSAENQSKIKEALAVWEKYASEYQPGKKSKVCDVNLDEIYFNITMAYLALGKGEELKTNWEKCKKIKGNMTAEGYAGHYLPRILKNHESHLAKKDQPIEPISIFSKEEQYNNMILQKTLLNYYFTQKHGNLGVISEYFPAQAQYLSSVKTTKRFDEGTIETIEHNYAPFGKLSSLIYTVEGGLNDDKTREYAFNYNKNNISEITLNNKARLFTIRYTDGLISEITHHYNNNNYIIYKFKETEAGKTEIRLTVKNGEKIQDSRTINWVKYDDQYNVTAVYISPYMNKELKYDDNGNIVEMTAVNLADNTFTMPFTVEVDSKGNATKIESKGLVVNSSFNYIF